MKRIFLIFYALFGFLCSGTTNADTDKKIYIDPTVAQNVINKHFAHIISENLKNTNINIDDNTMLTNIIDTYNEMLKQNDGFVSVNGVINVCNIAFQYLNNNVDTKQIINQKCLDFVKDLVTIQPVQNTDSKCPYTISKVNNSQTKIKYTLPDNSGFIRNGGSIAWRFFNPGNLRGSSLQCTTIRTKPNGSFAVFPNAEVGKQALHELLSNNNSYRNLTVQQAIYKYAPPSKNNTIGYVNKLKNSGININVKLSDLTDAELKKLENMIMIIEGWEKTGTETQF